MKKTAIVLFFVICLLSVNGQPFSDKIIIVVNTFQNQSISDFVERLYSSDTITITNKRQISGLVKELYKFDSKENLLTKFKIDTNYILNNPNELLKLYDGKYKFAWNEKQKEFIFEKLTNISTYKSELDQYLSDGSGYTMHNPYRHQFTISIYNWDNIVDIFTSRKNVWGYYFPYKDQQNREVYNFEVDMRLKQIIKIKTKIDAPLKGNDLLKYLVKQIVNDNSRELYKLAAFSYQKEIAELAPDFTIISTEQISAVGRYTWDANTIKITLKNNYMLPNVYIQFLASKVGETIYSRDSIKSEYQEIVSRIQELTFITDYLQQDSSARLDIYYFNNNGMNAYNIDGVNKNPSEWKKHDEYIERLKLSEKNNIGPSFEQSEATNTSQRLYCGCNYRFEHDFISQAIFFEITSDRNQSSIWFLLPDNTALLYHIEACYSENAKVLDKRLDSFSKQEHCPWACLRFDKRGNLVER